MIDQHNSNKFIDGWDDDKQEYNDQEEVKAEESIVGQAAEYVKDDVVSETESAKS